VFLVATVAVCFTLLDWIDARTRGWALREHDLVYSYGVLWRHTVIVPFARIQHVESSSGPLERRFGLMRFKCFTAGGSRADLTVKGLSVSSAQQARHYLLEQIRDDTLLQAVASPVSASPVSASVDESDGAL
jgi:hypothetical protein